MVLHLIQKSPFSHSALRDCLAIMNNDDHLLLMQDGVYACQDQSLIDLIHRNTNHQFYVIADDLNARGIQASDPLQLIDYAKFVELCAHSNTVISWY